LIIVPRPNNYLVFSLKNKLNLAVAVFSFFSLKISIV
jgi:hypothetical protein